MQDIVNPPAKHLAGFQIPDITFDKGKTSPLLRCHQVPHPVQIPPLAGGEIVDPRHHLIEFEEMFHQVRANKPGAAGHEPSLRLRQ